MMRAVTAGRHKCKADRALYGDLHAGEDTVERWCVGIIRDSDLRGILPKLRYREIDEVAVDGALKLSGRAYRAQGLRQAARLIQHVAERRNRQQRVAVRRENVFKLGCGHFTSSMTG